MSNIPTPTNFERLQFMARREEFTDGISLFARTSFYSVQTHYAMAQSLVFENEEPNSLAQPFITMELTHAQQLMDELWRVGLRPSEGTGSAGSLRATEKHLADMRLIAFQLLNQVSEPDLSATPIDDDSMISHGHLTGSLE